jgi:acyl-CoA synthetase (AMP-forming)/AMP-acid ligase II
MSEFHTIPELLAAQTAERPDQTFFVWDDARLTFAELDALSGRLAQALLKAGVGKGTQVGLFYPNGGDYVVAFTAVTRLGAVAVPMSTFSTPTELAWLLRNADVEVLLSAPGYRNRDFRQVFAEAFPGVDAEAADGPLFIPEAPSLRRVYFSPGGKDYFFDGVAARTGLASAALVAAAGRAVTPSDRMVIVHTSGSTSDPKGVMHTHGGVLDHVANLNRLRDLTASDILFSPSPHFWIGGLVYSLICAMGAGARLIGSGSADAAKVLDFIERERPNMCNGFAGGVAHFRNDPSFAGRDFSFLRKGNLYPIMPDDVRPADPDLRHQMLGATETASVFIYEFDETDQPERLRGSFGRVVTDGELRIVDPETLRECATGETGEMWVRGPFVMEGYYGRERGQVFTPDGWYRTGDLAYLNEDGFVFFKGRNNDMIKTAGANVSPREVESALAAVTGKLTYVVGVQDAVRGQIVAAGVVGGEPEDVDLDRLKPKLAAKLSAFKIPRKVVSLAEAEIPVLSSGKVNMRALTELIRDR